VKLRWGDDFSLSGLSGLSPPCHCEERSAVAIPKKSVIASDRRERGNLMNKRCTMRLLRHCVPRNDGLLFLGLLRLVPSEAKESPPGARNDIPFIRLALLARPVLLDFLFNRLTEIRFEF